MKRIRSLVDGFESRMRLCKRSEKYWFRAGCLLLLIYMECIAYVQHALLDYNVTYRFLAMNAAAVVPLCCLGIWAAGRPELSGDDERAAQRIARSKQLAFAAAIWAITFFGLLFWLKAYYPGSFDYDPILQYNEAIRGDYSDWHPTLHTWLFFTLPLKVFGQPAGIIFAQMLWFSLAVAYLFLVLYSSGCPRVFLACAWLYIAANPNTSNILLHPWKDTAMTIFATVMFAHLVRIYLSDGEWLNRWHNVAAFSLFAFLATCMRHNALLLVIPVFAVLFCFFRQARKRVVVSAAATVLACLILYGPVFSLFHVKRMGERNGELLGLPMTVLCDIYVMDGKSLDDETKAFMDSLMAPEEWRFYRLGNFNSIKFMNGTGRKVETESTKSILRYTLNAASKHPKLAIRAVSLLTRLVWSFDGESGWTVGFYIPENPFGLCYSGDEQMKTDLDFYAAGVSNSAAKYLFCYPGAVILVLLFLAVGRIGGGNLARSFLVLAPMTYNFGTMLLLTGPDFRFFHFNFLIVVPLVYLLLRGREHGGAPQP